MEHADKEKDGRSPLKHANREQNARRSLKHAKSEQGGISSLKHDSLVLLRLPMIGQRMRRVLHAWRKLAKKEKRLNYIRDMLPHKVSVR